MLLKEERNREIRYYVGVAIVFLIFLVLFILKTDSIKKKHIALIKNTENIESTNGVLNAPVFAYGKFPQKYISKYSVVRYMKIGEIGWVSNILIDSTRNIWLSYNTDVKITKSYFNDIKVIKDSCGFIVDIRYCEGRKFQMSGFSKEDCESICYPVYKIITN